MKNSFIENDDLFEIEFECLINKEWNFIKVVSEKYPNHIFENTEEEFIAEHYWGCTKLTDT